MPETSLVVRTLHIFFAAIWGGGSLYHGFVVMRGWAWNEPEARKQWWLHSKFGPYLAVAAFGTVVMGGITYVMNGGATGYTPRGHVVLSVGMGMGLVAAINGIAGHLPAALHLAKATEARDQDAVAVWERREHILDNISAVTIGVATVCMITFRWF